MQPSDQQSMDTGAPPTVEGQPPMDTGAQPTTESTTYRRTRYECRSSRSCFKFN